MDASIIIPAFGRTDLLRRAVTAALSQEYPAEAYEIIVVDSSPDDANEHLVRELQSDARCKLRVLRKEPEGPGPSRTRGARESTGRILAFLDSDCLPATGWLAAGMAAFAEGVGLVQGRTVPEGGMPASPLTSFLCIERESFVYESANIFYLREAFFQTDGFHGDPQGGRSSVLGGEDADLAWQVKSNGWESRFAAEAEALHPVEPLTLWRWVFNKRLYVFPRLVRRWPQIRRFMWSRFFFEPAHAWAALAWVGLLAGAWFPPALVAVVPYLAFRLCQRSGTFRGPGRLMRAGAYFLRDSVSVAVLLAGSVRYGALLL